MSEQTKNPAPTLGLGFDPDPKLIGPSSLHLGVETSQDGPAISEADLETEVFGLEHLFLMNKAAYVDFIVNRPTPILNNQVSDWQPRLVIEEVEDYHENIRQLIKSRHPATSYKAIEPDLFEELLYELTSYYSNLVFALAKYQSEDFKAKLYVYHLPFLGLDLEKPQLPPIGRIFAICQNTTTIKKIRQEYETLYKPDNQISSSDKSGLTGQNQITSAYQSLTFARTRAWELVATALNYNYAELMDKKGNQTYRDIESIQPSRHAYLGDLDVAYQLIDEAFAALEPTQNAINLETLASLKTTHYSHAKVHKSSLVWQFKQSLLRLTPNKVKNPPLPIKNYRKKTVLSALSTLKYVQEISPENLYAKTSTQQDKQKNLSCDDRVAKMIYAHAKQEMKFFYTPNQLIQEK